MPCCYKVHRQHDEVKYSPEAATGCGVEASPLAGPSGTAGKTGEQSIATFFHAPLANSSTRSKAMTDAEDIHPHRETSPCSLLWGIFLH